MLFGCSLRFVWLSSLCLLPTHTGIVAAQRSSFTGPTTPSSVAAVTPTPTVTGTSAAASSLIYTTYTNVYVTTLSSTQPRPSGAPSIQSVFVATATFTSPIAPVATTALPSPSIDVTGPAPMPEQTALPLHTVIDPASGILGALLIISGLLLAFVGHRSRWLICLISGFYSLALVTLCIILRVGVAGALDDPNKTLKGLYLLACLSAGAIGGGAAVIFRTGGLLLACTLGGFSTALFLQACKPNGLIETQGLRYILYVGLGALTFSLACHPRLQSYLLIISSAQLGSTATILGIDCFTRANLKEFYTRNLGFDDLFRKKNPEEFAHNRWFLSTASIIQLGVLGGLTLMAISFQSRMWAEFRASLLFMKHDDEERRLRARAKRAAKKVFATAQRDLRDWEERHGYPKTANTAKSVQRGASEGKTTEYEENFLLRQERQALPMSLLSLRRISSADGRSGTSCEPKLDRSLELPSSERVLGEDMSDTDTHGQALQSSEGLTEQQALLDEIATIRKSIDALRSASLGLNQTEGSSDTVNAVSVDGALRLSRNLDLRTSPPWLTEGRHSRAISLTPDSAFVNEELFAGSATADSAPFSGTGRVGFFDKWSRPASLLLNETQAPEGSAFRLHQSSPHLPSMSERKTRSISVLAGGTGEVGSNLPHNSPGDLLSHHRTIVESSENAHARYARALGRTETGAKSPSGETDNRRRIDHGKRGTTMSMGELQARHQDHLRAMQRPTSMKIEEEAKLLKAKEEWMTRSKLERRRWETAEKLQREAEAVAALPKVARKGKGGAALEQSQPLACERLATLEGVAMQSGVARAREWRKSLEPSKRPSEQRERQVRRHSSHAKPLLDFTAETVREKAKDRVQRP